MFLIEKRWLCPFWFAERLISGTLLAKPVTCLTAIFSPLRVDQDINMASGGSKMYGGLPFLLVAPLMISTVHSNNIEPIQIPIGEQQSRGCIVRADEIDRWSEDSSDRRLVAFGSKGVASFPYCTLWEDRMSHQPNPTLATQQFY